MSKLELILASNRPPRSFRRKPGSRRARILLALTALLIAFVFMTQPQVRDMVEPFLVQMLGL